jgi:hypothetical protein
MLTQFKNMIAASARITILVFAVSTVIVWSARLVHRIDALEAQVQALAATTVGSSASDPRGGQQATLVDSRHP